MPIKLPELDNKTYDDLLKEMIASIPKYSKEWTNFNPSDPGITILELLAWITEGLIYRTNRIPEKSYLNFLKLVAGPDEIYDTDDGARNILLEYLGKIINGTEKIDILSMEAAAQTFLSSRYTAVTEDDFKTLASEVSPDIKRVEVFPTDYSIQVMVIPELKEPPNFSDTMAAVKTYLDKRRLLGTFVDVQRAQYSDIDLSLAVTCEDYADSNIFGQTKTYSLKPGIAGQGKIEDLIAAAVFQHLDPLEGGPQKNGWPYGRNLIVYELYQIVEDIGNVVNVEILAPDPSLFPITIPGLIRLNSLEIAIKAKGA